MASQPLNPSIINHLSIGTNNMAQACTFYDKVLGLLGVGRVLDFYPEAVAYGREFPEFWVGPPHDGEKATVGNGVHFAFDVGSEDEVHAFYQAALDAGAKSEGEPGPRPEYTAAYYGCFLRDPDGNKIEAVFWDPSKRTDE